MPPRILALAGSLRRDSFNRRLVTIAAGGARAAGAEVMEIDLKDYELPVYDADLESAEGLPEGALRLKAIMKEHDGFLISAPEYNSSITAALKNAIDWASRPHEDEPPLVCFRGKVAGLMAASPGALGGLRGLAHVRDILGNIGVIVLPDQRAVSKAHEAFRGDGSLEDEKTQRAVEGIGKSVAEMVNKLSE